MYQTLVQDPGGQWRHQLPESIAEEQGLPVTAEELWAGLAQSLRRSFASAVPIPSLPFQTYFDAWAGGFRLRLPGLERPRRRRCRHQALLSPTCRCRQPFPETKQALQGHSRAHTAPPSFQTPMMASSYPTSSLLGPGVRDRPLLGDGPQLQAPARAVPCEMLRTPLPQARGDRLRRRPALRGRITAPPALA